MSFFCRIPMYIAKGFSQDWLTDIDICAIDASMCNRKDRQVYLHNIKNISINVEVYNSSIGLCVDWCTNREVYIKTLKAFEGNDFKNCDAVVPVLSKLKSLKLTKLRDWHLINILLKQHHPVLEDIAIESRVVGKCTAKFPSSLLRLSLTGCIFNLTEEDLLLLFSRVNQLQYLNIRHSRYLKSLFDKLSIIFDKVQHTLTTLKLSFGKCELQSELELIASTCTQLISLDLNVDCDELNITCLHQLPQLSHLSLRRVVLWEIDDNILFPSLTHLSVSYDRLQSPKLKFFPALSYLTLTGSTNAKVARILMWLRLFENIITVNVKECNFIEADRIKLIQESIELRSNNYNNNRRRHNSNNQFDNNDSSEFNEEGTIKWIFE